MTYLRWIGLMSSLLIVGAFGDLLAPLPSDALTVKIDNVSVGLSPTSAQQPSGPCSPGYNLCSFITPNTYGGWIVGNVSASNKSRIMIGDNSAANSLDLLKMTGITFRPVVTTGTKITTVVITHTYNAGGGNPKGNYSWGYGMAGYFDPPINGKIAGDRLKQLGTGTFAAPSVQLGSGVDTGVLAIPSAANVNASVTKTSGATVVKANCDTGSAKCAPTITQTFTITSVDGDTLVLSDSVIAAGGTCRAVEEVIPIPPHLYALMLKLDPNAPNDINLLSAWLKKMGQKYLKNKPAKVALAYLIRELDKWLAKTVPGTCPEIQEEINQVVEDDVEAELEAMAAVAAATGETFETGAPGGTITITKNTGQETSDTFTFDISGPASSTETIAMGGTNSQEIVVTVEPGTYNIIENELSGWSLGSANCGDTGDPTSTGVVGLEVPAGGNVDCTFNNNAGAIFNSDDYRVINLPGVTWNDARAQAQALGSGWDLATINSQEEQNFIETLLPNLNELTGTYDYWIGGEQPSGSQEPGGNWQWAPEGRAFYHNGQPGYGYANWGTGEPNNIFGGESENHVTVDNRYLWGWNDLDGAGGVQGYVAKRASPGTS